MEIAKLVADLRTKVTVSKNGKVSMKGRPGYGYYKIDDIYNEVKMPMKELGIVTAVTHSVSEHNPEMIIAKLVAIAVKDGSSLEFSVSTKDDNLMGQNEYQTAGSKCTYTTKYLYGLLLCLDDGAFDADIKLDSPENSGHVVVSREDMIKVLEEMNKNNPQGLKQLYHEEAKPLVGVPKMLPNSLQYIKGSVLKKVYDKIKK